MHEQGPDDAVIVAGPDKLVRCSPCVDQHDTKAIRRCWQRCTHLRSRWRLNACIEGMGGTVEVVDHGFNVNYLSCLHAICLVIADVVLVVVGQPILDDALDTTDALQVVLQLRDRVGVKLLLRLVQLMKAVDFLAIGYMVAGR